MNLLKSTLKTLLALALAYLFGSGMGCAFKSMTVLHADDRTRDIVFAGRKPGCVGDAVECADTLYFNGDWSTVRLCKGYAHHSVRCVPFEGVLHAKRD